MAHRTIDPVRSKYSFLIYCICMAPLSGAHSILVFPCHTPDLAEIDPVFEKVRYYIWRSMIRI